MEWSEAKIIAAALLLGARQVPGWTMDEERLTHRLPPLRPPLIDKLRLEIVKGNDPLGDIFCSLRPARQRRLPCALSKACWITSAILS
jgi:adenine-specific DNA-methyltransferase